MGQKAGEENTGNNIFPPPPPSLLSVFLHTAQSINRRQLQEIVVIVAGPEKKTEEYHLEKNPLGRLK